MQNETVDRLLTRKEVEQRFGISKRYLETAAMKEEGPRRVNVGRLVRYRVKDVVDWIENNTSPEAL
jgi:predicted DNA-binding transcriptional regulator AlpA